MLEGRDLILIPDLLELLALQDRRGDIQAVNTFNPYSIVEFSYSFRPLDGKKWTITKATVIELTLSSPEPAQMMSCAVSNAIDSLGGGTQISASTGTMHSLSTIQAAGG